VGELTKSARDQIIISPTVGTMKVALVLAVFITIVTYSPPWLISDDFLRSCFIPINDNCSLCQHQHIFECSAVIILALV